MPEKLKILYVSREYPPETAWGGIGIYIFCVAPALASFGHEVHLLSCVLGQRQRDYMDRGVFIHRRGQISIRGLGRISKILRLPKTIARLQTGLSTYLEYRRLGINFDVIEYPDWGAEGWFFALFHTKPLVARLHTPLPVIRRYHQIPMNRDISWASSMESFAVHRAHHITSPSLLLIQELKDVGWLTGRDVEVIPNSIDWSNLGAAQPVKFTQPVVLFLGRLERLKAPEVLVEAMSVIRREMPEAKAIFVGRCSGVCEGLSYLEWMKKRFANETGSCEFVGNVPRHELTYYLSSSRVVTVPSLFESYSMVALEAMAARRPVVVTETTGVAGFVEGTGAGRIVPPGNPQALAEALLPFLDDADHAARIGEKARAAVQEWLDPDKIAAQHEKAYLKAITSFDQ